MNDFTSVHAQVIIAFSLVMLVLLLLYIAFFKDFSSKQTKRR
jgi:uncharacterized membrane protein affecting hemolysin expression